MTEQELQELMDKANNEWDQDAVKKLIDYYKSIGDTENTSFWSSYLEDDTSDTEDEEPILVINKNIELEPVKEEKIEVSDITTKIEEYFDKYPYNQLETMFNLGDIDAGATLVIKYNEKPYGLTEKVDKKINELEKNVINDSSLKQDLVNLLCLKCAIDSERIVTTFYDIDTLQTINSKREQDRENLENKKQEILGFRSVIEKLNELSPNSKETIWLKHWFNAFCKVEDDNDDWNNLVKSYGFKGFASIYTSDELFALKNMNKLVKPETSEEKMLYSAMLENNKSTFETWVNTVTDKNEVYRLFKGFSADNGKFGILRDGLTHLDFYRFGSINNLDIFNVWNMNTYFNSPFAGCDGRQLSKLVDGSELKDSLYNFVETHTENKKDWIYMNILRFLKAKAPSTYKFICDKVNNKVEDCGDNYIYIITSLLNDEYVNIEETYSQFRQWGTPQAWSNNFDIFCFVRGELSPKNILRPEYEEFYELCHKDGLFGITKDKVVKQKQQAKKTISKVTSTIIDIVLFIVMILIIFFVYKWLMN